MKQLKGCYLKHMVRMLATLKTGLNQILTTLIPMVTPYQMVGKRHMLVLGLQVEVVSTR